MEYGIIGILLVVIIILGIKLHKKIVLDNSQINKLNQNVSLLSNEISNLQYQKDDLNKDVQVLNNLIKEKTNEIQDYNEQIQTAQSKYNYELRDRTEELNNYFTKEKNNRQLQLDEEFERKCKDNEESIKLQYANLINTYENFLKEAQQRAESADKAADKTISEAYDRAQKAIEGAKEEEEKFQAILAPLQQYEKEKQERLYYTIQVPDEYKDDIDFLLTTVAEKIQHPDIINKLVWAEYVKPYIDETFKRINIEDKSGIYKLTSLLNGKCYIGKSTNIKKRISDHFKSVIGISSIADQAVHHAIAREGYWNWTIEPIIYCDKDKLSELEKYYINFFKAQEFGYNKNSGG